MSDRQIELTTNRHRITLFVNSLSGPETIEDCREVKFELPGGGRRRAVFFLSPDKNSNDPYSIKPSDEWDVPVRWDDPTMLFVPTLSDEAVLTAMRYIIDNGLEDEAFENEDEIRLDDSPPAIHGPSGANQHMALRSLFIITTLIAVVCALCVSAERSWFGPARQNVELQRRFDQIIADRGWQGQINPIHYFDEVRILINNVPADELQTIFPVLHEIRWLRLIKIYEPRLSETELERWRSNFPNCIVLNGNAKYDDSTK